MIQQGQVFKLKVRCADGEPLWAYRYRIAGRGSARLQAGGFASKAEAQKALQNKLARIGPGRTRGAPDARRPGRGVPRMRIRGSPSRWQSSVAARQGDRDVRRSAPCRALAEQVYAWRITIPEGHRFEATQALRQVLNRAVAWELIDSNPAKRGVPNPRRRCREKRPFESWAQIEARRAARADLRTDGHLRCRDRASTLGAVRARAARRRPRGRRRLRATGVRERSDQAHQDPAEHTRGSAAGEGARGARAAAGVGDNPILFPNARGGRIDFRVFDRRHWKPAQKPPGSNRSATSTTCATPTPPSRSAPASRCLPSRASSARASR